MSKMTSSALDGFDFLTEVVVLVAMWFSLVSFAMFACVSALCPQIIAPYVRIGINSPVKPHFIILGLGPKFALVSYTVFIYIFFTFYPVLRTLLTVQYCIYSHTLYDIPIQRTTVTLDLDFDSTSTSFILISE